MDWEAARGWSCEEGGGISVLDASPLSLMVFDKPGALREAHWFGFLREDGRCAISRWLPGHDDSDPAPDFDWFLHFDSGAVKVMLGGGYLPLDLDPADVRPVALAGAVELLNELAAKLAAAATHEGGA
jgi:hypothetical protein